MEMRLGKTLTALRWLRTLSDPFPCLVVAPLAVLPGWEIICHHIDRAG